jgi:hypothetical protein
MLATCRRSSHRREAKCYWMHDMKTSGEPIIPSIIQLLHFLAHYHWESLLSHSWHIPSRPQGMDEGRPGVLGILRDRQLRRSRGKHLHVSSRVLQQPWCKCQLASSQSYAQSYRYRRPSSTYGMWTRLLFDNSSITLRKLVMSIVAHLVAGGGS